MATKVVDLDLSSGIAGLAGLQGYHWAMLLLRWKDEPLGRVTLPIENDAISTAALAAAVEAEVGTALRGCVLDRLLATDLPDPPEPPPPCATIVVCTRNRPDDLRRCLASITPAIGPAVDAIVVDNDPPDDATERVCRDFPVRHVIEKRRGLNWARSRALRLAEGEVVAFIDDDAVASAHWLDAIRKPFRDPAVAAVTGLVMPLELENAAQEQFERHCSFVRGFRRRRFDAATIHPIAAGLAGAGACMAVRRTLADELGLFRVELDCGTVTESGGDTYGFYRLIALGYSVVYEPRALAWHRHRRDEAALQRCLYGYGVGTYVYLLRTLLGHREVDAIREGAAWLRHHHLPEIFAPLLPRRRRKQPLALTLAEVRGLLAAPWAYAVSRRRERWRWPEAEARPVSLSAAE